MSTRSFFSIAAGLTLAAIAGCDLPVAQFDTNQVYALKLEKETDAQLNEALDETELILTALFGTPDNPRVPAVLAGDPDLAGLMSEERLQRAAGPVASQQDGTHTGLYREHCVHCHGVTGDGQGPTASFLNPYPRDYRMGIFKFKSTPRGSKPTRDDLVEILNEGIRGTSMPSFALLEDEDVQALADYVIYLSIRGELERRLLYDAAFELGYGSGDLAPEDRLVSMKLREEDPEVYQEQLGFILDYTVEIAESWLAAEDNLQAIPQPSADVPQWPLAEDASPEERERMLASLARGRELFHGQIGNCANCHGSTALGDGQANDYDDWTKDWTTKIGIDPQQDEQVKPFLEVGALPPRNLPPRNLRLGVYRGGGRANELYRRILYGIEGSPMPGASVVPEPGPTGLTTDDIWHVVNYVLSLPYEAASQVGRATEGIERERL